MNRPTPEELLERVRSLPAGAWLMERLGVGPGAQAGGERGVHPGGEGGVHLGGDPGVYLVGGSVRDLLLGGRPSDLDLVVEGGPDAVAARLGGRIVAHDRFGTATVTAGGFSYDIARARRESYERPGALPEVSPADLEHDLLRRDFTVNAIALALTGTRAGALTAVPGALDDLDAHILRVLHDRSFIDDPTRMLRLARYASRLGFEIEPYTRELALEAVRSGALDTVSGPRIGAELRLAAREDDPVAALSALAGLGLDRAVHPRFGLEEPELARRALELLPRGGRRAELCYPTSLYARCASKARRDRRRDRLALAVAARRIPAGELAALLDRLAFEAADRDAIVATATRADDVAAGLTRAQRPSEIAEAVAGAPPELVALAGALGPSDAAGAWLGRLRHVRLQIDGRDLLEAGLPEGPAIGKGLAAALAAKLDGHVNGHAEELAVALAAARDGRSPNDAP